MGTEDPKDLIEFSGNTERHYKAPVEELIAQVKPAEGIGRAMAEQGDMQLPDGYGESYNEYRIVLFASVVARDKGIVRAKTEEEQAQVMHDMVSFLQSEGVHAVALRPTSETHFRDVYVAVAVGHVNHFQELMRDTIQTNHEHYSPSQVKS